MSRADDLRERFEAELTVIELEDKLSGLKSAKKVDQEALRDVKLELREARRVWRELRAGAVEVSPSVIDTAATVQES